MVIVLNLATGVTTPISANPDRSGGSSDVAISASNVYFANQTGGSVFVPPPNNTTITSLKADLPPPPPAVRTNRTRPGARKEEPVPLSLARPTPTTPPPPT